jgi:propionyl-CoA synthetase
MPPEQEQSDAVAQWAEQAKRIDWFSRPESIPAGPDVRLVGGSVNLCFNALDRHVIRGRADELALVTDRRTFSYSQLLERVAQLGGGLRELRVQVGDRVSVVVPPGVERVVALLACARVGAVTDATEPKVVIGPARPSGEHQPEFCVIFPSGDSSRLGPFDIAWEVLMRPGSFQPAACAEVPATQPTATDEPEPVGRRTVRLAAGMLDIRPGQELVVEGDDQLLAVLIAGGTAVLRAG